MFETVTVDEALAKGKMMISRPLMFIQVLILAGFIALNWQHHHMWATLALPVMFLSIAIYRSIAITRWRLWAFENVRNVHELKQRALKIGLLSPEGGFWEKLEWYSREDKQRLAIIAEKFKLDDLVVPDHTTTNETRIYISRVSVLIGAVFLAVWFGLGIYFLVRGEWITVCFFFISGALIAFFSRKTFIDKSPQIIINDEGIKTAAAEFYTWEEIGNETVEQIGEGRDAKVVLAYDCPGGREEFPIDDLDTNVDKLSQLLIKYRQRSGKIYKYQKNNYLTETGRRLTRTS
ncbi:hypothetical protein HQ865_13975 [Mucilaginibacter mali]|uniref:Uncharacterized protein n=1 Tax=Mucilaginibacter mali TaxID=2740462 RepID=A0A7D4PUL1_9SPHI|nr:hypothetical protein [Mucilaginibacter mali]QKJ30808.1 hypothetical protein HQ865_13975 [Mucilaginibacter mali]